MTAEESDPNPLWMEQLGGSSLTNRLFPLIYEELRSLARLRLSQGGDQVLQPTALVHEVYLRLIDQTRIDVTDRKHFLAIAARTLHWVLVDAVRAQRTAKRGGEHNRVTVVGELSAEGMYPIDLLALDEALARLQATHPRRAQIVELRFFGGLSIEELAAVLEISPRTVSEDWNVARAYLFRELRGGGHE